MSSSTKFRIASFLALAAVVASRAVAVQADPAQAAAAPKRSVLVITLDTTRRDFVGFMGRAPSPTPMLDHLAQVSVVFTDAVTSAPLTLPAHTSLMTGLYPARHGVRDDALGRVPAEARTLAEILHEHGYATRAATAAFVLDPIFGLDQGFDRYRAPPRTVARPDAPAKDELDARRMVDRALVDLRELAPPAEPGAAAAAPPFFYWLHLNDAHFPYAPPVVPQLDPAVAADPVQAVKAYYEAEIRFMDGELGRLFAELQKMALLEQMIIVVASDHGESLRDTPEGTHGFFLYDPTVRVPLFLRSPDLAPQLVNVPVSLVDLAPTLLALLGIDASGERFDGIDLLPWIADPAKPPPDRALMLESLYGWRDFGWAPAFGCTRGALKYLRSAREELYDRSADPRERKNLFAAEEPRAVALGRDLDGRSESAALPPDWRSLPDPLVKVAAMGKFNEVMVAASEQKVDRALDLLRALVAEEPASAAMREQFALMLLNAGSQHVAEATAELDAVLKLDPRRARSWFARARCAELAAETERLAAKALRDQGKPKEARSRSEAEQAARTLVESSLRRSLECEPDYPDALTMLGRTLNERGERTLARGDKAAARALFVEAGAMVDRLVKVVAPASPEWTEGATARERMKRRIAEIDAAK